MSRPNPSNPWGDVLRTQARYRVRADREVREAFYAGLVYGVGIGMVAWAALVWAW